jgi:hypothetical protein
MPEPEPETETWQQAMGRLVRNSPAYAELLEFQYGRTEYPGAVQ